MVGWVRCLVDRVGDEIRQEVPFDMAKETLKSIRLWIDKITQLSVCVFGGTKIPNNEMIVLKRDMVGQLIVLSCTLLGDDLEEIEEFFEDIKLKRGDIRTGGGWSKNVIVYSKEVDNKLDECMKGIQKSLKKYFVPTFNEGEKY